MSAVAKIYMVNLNVTDMDRTIDFYGRLGFTVYRDFVHTDPAIGAMWGIDEFKSARLVWMALGPGRTPLLDLLQFDPPSPPRERPVLNQIGPTRLVFLTEDMDAFMATLERAGAELVCPLVEIRGNEGQDLKCVYFRDPDGNLLEAMWYPEPTEFTGP